MAYNSFINKQVNANQPIFQFKKDRNNTTVVVADGLGNIQFQGFDGTNYLTTSQILSVASGTIAANRIGSNLEFYTHPDSVTASTQCMVIESTGQVQINNPSSNVASLFVTNDQSTPNISLRTANATAANSPHIHFTRSRAGIADVLAADDLGRLEFRGYQGGVAIEAATIRSQAETVNGASVSGNFQFLTRPTSYAALATRMNISADGAVSILNTVAGNIALTVNATATGGVEVQQNAAANAGMRIYTSLGNINGPRFEMLKSRSGGNVVANDNIGQFVAYGYQTGYQYAAQIVFKAESVAASRVSGAISFWTNSTASANAVRLNISADGNVTISNPASGVALTIVGGGETITAGNLLLSAGNVNIPATTSAVGQYQIAGQTALHAYGTNNIFAGASCGNFTGSGTVNTAVGQGSFFSFTTGSQNTLVGHGTGQSITTGNYNVGLGYWSAINTGAGNSNICINNFGAVESNTLRIGSATGAGNQQLNRAFICGIDGVNVGSVAKVVTMASDQLGTATITAGTGILVTPTANTITISTTNGISWVEVTVTTQAMAVDTGYIANNVALVTLTLPTVAVVGDRVRVAGKGAGLWLIAQNAGQVIHFGSMDTTVGVGGSLAAILRYDCVELLCITANTDWVVLSSVGNLTVV